jgi:hypothetical protein
VLGLENLVIRKRLQRWFETGDAGGLDHGAGLGSATFRHIMLMGNGQVKHAMVSGDQQRELLIFSTTHGYLPFDARAPAAIRMDERSRQINAAKENDLRMQALEAAKPADEVIIDVKKGDTEADLEPLESVNPDAFGGGGSRR